MKPLVFKSGFYFIYEPSLYPDRLDILEIFRYQMIILSDAAALQCCSGHTEEDIKKHLLNHMLDIFNPDKFKEFEGDLIPTRIKMIKEQKEQEIEQRKQRQLEYQRKMEEQRAKEREYLRKKREKERESLKSESKLVNNDSKIVDLNYENVELRPTIDEKPIHKKVSEKSEESVLIKKQSKDETTIELLGINEKESKKTVFDALNDIVQTYLPTIQTKTKPFSVEEFYIKLQTDFQYPVNQSWTKDFSVMSCPAQVFKERFSVQGEFFDSYL